MTLTLFSILLVLFSSIIGAFGPIYLKKATRKKISFSSLLKNKYLLIGLSAYAIGLLFFILALRYGPLSVLYPLSSVMHVWVTLLSAKILNEKITVSKWLGIVVILLGVVFIAVSF